MIDGLEKARAGARGGYFNTASFGVPAPPTGALARELHDRLLQSPDRVLTGLFEEALEENRCRLARFLGVGAARLTFTSNVTEGIQAALDSIPGRAGGEIVVWEGEYPPVLAAVVRAARRRSLTVRIVRLPLELSYESVVEGFLSATTAATCAVVMSHVVSHCGFVMPVEVLGEVFKSGGIQFIVDGAQAPGFTPVVDAVRASSVYVGSGHKWLRAPCGVGFVHWADGVPAHVVPYVTWMSLRRNAERNRVFECRGTRDLTAWLCVSTALQCFEEATPGMMVTEAKARRERLVDALSGNKLSIYPGGVEPQGGYGVFVSVPMDSTGKVHKAQDWLLSAHGMRVGISSGPSRSYLRISCPFDQPISEVDQLADALSVLPAS